jgi:histone H3/H4
MTLADSHVKALLKEGTSRAGAPATGAEWRVSPEAVSAAKAKAEDYLRQLGEQAARNCAQAKRSTLKGEDVREPAAPAPAGDAGGETGYGSSMM